MRMLAIMTLITLLIPAAAHAELLRVELKTLGMD